MDGDDEHVVVLAIASKCKASARDQLPAAEFAEGLRETGTDGDEAAPCRLAVHKFAEMAMPRTFTIKSVQVASVAMSLLDGHDVGLAQEGPEATPFALLDFGVGSDGHEQPRRTQCDDADASRWPCVEQEGLGVVLVLVDGGGLVLVGVEGHQTRSR